MISLLAIGDWGRRGSVEQRAVAEGMARAARRLRPRLVLTTGDNFYDDGVCDLEDAHWHESFEAVYADSALQMPWHPVLGNHDYRGSVAAQIAYTHRSGRWMLPARYYTVARRIDARHHAQFFFLDTTPFLDVYRPGGAEHTPGVKGQCPEAQLRWLGGALAASESAWKIVVGHHPIRSGSPFHGDAPELQERLAPLLRAGGADVYLCGHEHDLQHLTGEDGLHHVITGAGSECRETGRCAATRFSQGALGFASLTLHARSLRLRFHDAEGRVLYRALIEKPEPEKAPPASTAATSRFRQLLAEGMRMGLVQRVRASGGGERVLLQAGAWRGWMREAEAVRLLEGLLGGARAQAEAGGDVGRNASGSRLNSSIMK